MLEFIKPWFENSVEDEDVVLFFSVLSPIVIVYVGVFLYLVFGLCYSACCKGRRKNKTMEPVLGRTVFQDGLLIRSEPPDFPNDYEDHRPNFGTQESAQSSLCEALKGEDLKAAKTSLRKTSGIFCPPNSNDTVTKIEVPVEEKGSSSSSESLTPQNSPCPESSSYSSFNSDNSQNGSTYFGSTISTLSGKSTMLKNQAIPMKDYGTTRLQTFHNTRQNFASPSERSPWSEIYLDCV